MSTIITRSAVVVESLCIFEIFFVFKKVYRRWDPPPAAAQYLFLFFELVESWFINIYVALATSSLGKLLAIFREANLIAQTV